MKIILRNSGWQITIHLFSLFTHRRVHSRAVNEMQMSFISCVNPHALQASDLIAFVDRS